MVWYSHLFENSPQFIVIHTVRGFGTVNKAEIDVFLELSCFFDDPADVGNLISGSSAFSKSSLNIWKLMVRVLLKAGLENFERDFAGVWENVERDFAGVWGNVERDSAGVWEERSVRYLSVLRYLWSSRCSYQEARLGRSEVTCTRLSAQRSKAGGGALAWVLTLGQV